MKTFKHIPENHCLSTFSTTGQPLISRDIFIMEEVWKEVIGYEGLYQVSNLGKVKSIKKNILLKPVFDKRGYNMVSLYINGKGKTNKIHRIIAIAFIPNPENKPQVNHKDCNKNNNSVENLEWNTNRENIQHAYNNGLKQSSIDRIKKLKAKSVINIITGEEFESCTAAAKSINYSQSRLSSILLNDKINKTNLKYK
jgi:hypothetical protein